MGDGMHIANIGTGKGNTCLIDAFSMAALASILSGLIIGRKKVVVNKRNCIQRRLPGFFCITVAYISLHCVGHGIHSGRSGYLGREL